ncbi:hypothetical protein ADH76_02605 [Enterocloster clostridioformis]|uniref:hypothetical protein n=1 Tax=Enterocloster clostridioformis TaxID=1531 RepID=UPI00080CB807|nr:hypothetical protein [Enterocloster clostridioformis]ANU44742.1 hypothetical protein A4V08_01815 [Lachnoclostridium sp. YL32]NDO27889.1 hypothetical protein [Enterocloster clostridioformis]OXE70350.1 hypothetical protein ADH76_02605 [Enterocloster clostridioformis]QQR00497.1 hypothetical protein I5Q83_32835 [Enterocloster clostridioformis]
MQNKLIKAGKTVQYFTILATVTRLEEQDKYEGMLLLRQKGKERARYEASDIRVLSKSKETVYKQLRQIAELYPPKEDIHILDLEENKA